MCSVGGRHDQLLFSFKPLQTSFRLTRPEVVGFASGVETTQADVDGICAALEGLYDSLDEGQQAVLADLILQAGRAIA